MIKNLNIFIFVYFCLYLTFLGEIRHNINHNMNISLIIIDLKIISQELLDFVDLMRTQVFSIYKLIKVVIVSIDKDLIFAVF